MNATIFPATSLANEQGLLAIGGNMSANTLIEAYSHGIFPWFNLGDPILWWSPAPRMVFYPKNFHISKSLRKTLNRQLLGDDSVWCMTVNQSFNEVMQACSKRAEGSWIHGDFFSAYQALHQQGLAFSLELRIRASHTLIAGLYGVYLGQMFFGESMFSALPNTSKCILAIWTKWMAEHDYPIMDVQVSSKHLQSLGAVEIARDEFDIELQRTINKPQSVLPEKLFW